MRASLLSGAPDMVGVSVAVTAIPRLELEAGTGWVGDFNLFEAPTTSMYLRGGPRFSLYDGRDADGVGGSLSLALMAGGRTWTVHSSSHAPIGSYDRAVRRSSDTHEAINLVAALETTVWLFEHFGLQAQVVAGANLWLDEGPEYGTFRGQDFFARSLDLRLSLGAAF